MKKLFIIMLSLFSVALTANAQTKKQVTKNNTKTKSVPAKQTTKTNPTNVITTKTSSTTGVTPEKTEEKAIVNKASEINKTTKTNDNDFYKTALGLKFIYGISLTGKHFIKQKHAIEGILRYNGAGGLGSNIALTALYEYHNNIPGIDGLRWYLGGGGYVNHFSWKDTSIDGVTTFGISGVIGLEYKIGTLPLAISADWVPGYVISNNVGFSAENGGIGIKYTF